PWIVALGLPPIVAALPCATLARNLIRTACTVVRINVEFIVRADRDVIQGVETFGKRRRLQFSQGCRKSGNGDLLFSLALIVAADGLAQGRLKKISDYFEARVMRAPDIARPVGGQRICVINHERTLFRQALGEYQFFA